MADEALLVSVTDRVLLTLNYEEEGLEGSSDKEWKVNLVTDFLVGGTRELIQ